MSRTWYINYSFTLQLIAPKITAAWVGIGFGSTMLTSQMLLCHSASNGSFHEHTPLPMYIAPPHQDDHPWVSSLVKGISNGTYLACQITRILSPGDGFHLNLNAQKDMPLIWAFNPISYPNFEKKLFSHHSNEI
jgi:hypothetical protein